MKKDRSPELTRHGKGNLLWVDVAECILDDIERYEGETDKRIKSWFEDLFRGGCASGHIGHLIYYSDTHKYYDKYYYEIEEVVREFEESTGERVNTKESGDDRKNFFAWLGFEEAARQIADEIGIEI